MARHGHPYIPIVEGDFSHDSGETAMQRLIAEHPDVDGVFIANDLMAQGALLVLRDHGQRIPDDVAVVGFDDSSAALACRPQLTTVRQPIEDMAAEMTRLLLSALEEPDRRSDLGHLRTHPGDPAVGLSPRRPSLCEQFADARDDLRAVQLDVGHELPRGTGPPMPYFRSKRVAPRERQVRGDLLARRSPATRRRAPRAARSRAANDSSVGTANPRILADAA